eukprot:COSAG01_NODE_24541_length_775_cov_1.267751_3_plen_78_part_01
MVPACLPPAVADGGSYSGVLRLLAPGTSWAGAGAGGALELLRLLLLGHQHSPALYHALRPALQQRLRLLAPPPRPRRA